MTIISDINKTIKDAFVNQPATIEKYGLKAGKTFDEQFSVISIESILFYAISVGIWISTQLFTQHKKDVAQILSEQLAHLPNWYANKAKLFQFGMELINDTDKYDNAGLSNEQINATKVVKYSSARNAIDRSFLYLKIATEIGGKRQPLPADQLTAFTEYMLNRVSDAGVRILIINASADEMALDVDIYYNPLILDSKGARLDGADNTPIQTAIKNYLYNLHFNGTYTNMQLVYAIQNVDGVEIAELKSAKSRYGTYTDFTEINAREIAYSGYYDITDEDLKLNFYPNE